MSDFADQNIFLMIPSGDNNVGLQWSKDELFDLIDENTVAAE